MQNINFDEVKKALDLIKKVNQMDTDIVMTEYLEYSKQNLTSTQLEFVLEAITYFGLPPVDIIASNVLYHIGLNSLYDVIDTSTTPEIIKTNYISVTNPIDFDYKINMVIYYEPYGGIPRREKGIVKAIFQDKLEILNETGKSEYITKQIVVQAEVKTIVY